MQRKNVMKAWKKISLALKKLLHTRKKKSGEIKDMSEKNPGSRVVCRIILDRHEVMSTQIMSRMIESLAEDVEKGKLVKMKKELSAIFSQHSNGLVDQMIEAFSDK